MGWKSLSQISSLYYRNFVAKGIVAVRKRGIAIACIVLWETTGHFSRNPLVVCAAIGGYTIICGVLLIGHVINSIVEKRLNALISIIGCILFVISGALVIDEWHDSSELLFKERKRNALAAGSLMIINGAVFLMDTISICRT
uniref:Uncharacterized protein n=1 Tax=Glossina palpalis gambiensis TaxID=67801 RepID=A0A1B0AQG3_9MUSC